MKRTYFILFALLLFCSMSSQAQEVAGTVVEIDENGMQLPLQGVSVFLMGSGNGALTNEAGEFHLHKTDSTAQQLLISFAGFVSDTLNAEGTGIKVVLQKEHVIDGVVVSGSNSDTYISSLKTAKTEVITSSELKSNACCNLSESFESNPTIDVSFADAVTGARQIQMLGLSGKYAQLLTDILPTVRGLGITYGLNYIPGPWIESINLNKGAGSVANGYESITGQIDVELKKPEKSESLYVNIYGNTEQRFEANIFSAQKLSGKWQDMFLIHAGIMQRKMDENNDGFMDLPMNRTITLMDRWKYESGDRIESMFGVKFLYDERTGGSMDFDPATDKLTTNAYGLGVNTNRVELFAKTSYGFPGKKWRSIGLQLSGIYHDQDAYYGLRVYDGTEQSLYANLIFLGKIGNTMHKYKAGISYLFDKYDEEFDAITMKRNESVPGAFFEYTYDNLKKFTLITGLRADVHNDAGLFCTGRLHARYSIGPSSTVRASIGNGLRIANIFAENSAYMASAREWTITGDLKPERAWNYGLNFTHNFFAGVHEGTFSIDLYRTDFTNQVIVDVDTDPSKVYFYNLTGASYSNSLQADVSYEWFHGFNTRLAYKFNNVEQTFGDELKIVPLVPRHRALLTITYKSRNKHWEVSSTTQWVGMQRLPDTQANPAMYQAPAESPSYFRLLGQVTYLLKSWEFYLGGENLGNYIQEDRIIAADDPFGPYFDTSIVWGPITGRTIYAGIRFSLK